MSSVKVIALLALTFASASAFAMGRADTKLVQPKLAEMKEAGFECKNSWPAGWMQLPPNAAFEVRVTCVHASGETKSGTIQFLADANQYSRCRDSAAQSIELK